MVGLLAQFKLSNDMAMLVLLMTGISHAYIAPKMPVISPQNCLFPANLDKHEISAHLDKVHEFCSKYSKVLQTTDPEATIDISQWHQRMVDKLFANITHLKANIKCENSTLRKLPMDTITTMSNVTVTILHNRFLSKLTLSPNVMLQNTRLIILDNIVLESKFLSEHGGKFDNFQVPESCSPSINGTAIKTFHHIVGCRRIYGDFIVDDTTVVDLSALALTISHFSRGCLRIVSKALKSLEFFSVLDLKSEFAPKCSGQEGLLSLIKVNLEPTWQNERTREKLEHIALNSRNMSTAQALGFYRNGRESECSGSSFTKEKCPVYYGDLVIDGCDEADLVLYENLVKIHGHLEIKNCKGATLSFPHLQKIMGDLDVSDNSELVALDVPKLVYVNEIHPVHNYKLQLELSQEVNLINAIQNPTNAEELGISAELGAFGAAVDSISIIHHFATIIVLAIFEIY